MIYDKNWIFVSLGLLIFFLIWYFVLRKYKVVPLVFPYEWNFALLSLFQKFLIFLILIISLILPLNIGIYQWIQIKKVPTLNIEVLFDVSLSMTAKDIKPDRFIATRNALIEFVKSLWVNYNIGLIVFSGKPVVWIPFSDAKKALIWKISHISMADFPPTLDFVWTAIGDVILLGSNQLVKFTGKQKHPWVLMLLTDWDSNKWIKVEDAIKYAQVHKIPIFVWAIWKDKYYTVGKDIYWNKVPTSINLKMLENIAKSTSGEYMHIQSKQDLLNILWKLRQYVKNYEITKQIIQYTYINYYLACILLILLILYGLLFIKYKLNS